MHRRVLGVNAQRPLTVEGSGGSRVLHRSHGNDSTRVLGCTGACKSPAEESGPSAGGSNGASSAPDCRWASSEQGRAGSVLGAALQRAGHRIVAAYGVSDVSRLQGRGAPALSALVTPEGCSLLRILYS